MAQAENPRTVQLQIEVPRALKQRLEFAASLRGMSLAEFVIWSAKEGANRAVEQSRTLKLSGRASAAFAKLLLNPPRPNPKAIAAARRYKKIPR